MVTCIILCIGLIGCKKNENQPTAPTGSQTVTESPLLDLPGNVVIVDTGDHSAPGTPPPFSLQELKDPEVVWWDIYQEDDVQVLVAQIENPNDIQIDVAFDVAFYKGNTEVHRENFSSERYIPANGSHFHDYIMMTSEDMGIDDVRLENIRTTVPGDAPITGTYKIIETDESQEEGETSLSIQVTLNAPATHKYIEIALYTDMNKNKHPDRGEVVAFLTETLESESEIITFDTTGYEYEDYEILLTAYN